MACQRLYAQKVLRPGVTTLERMVVTARGQAQEETYRRLAFLISEKNKDLLDNLLIPNEKRTPIFWLRQGATANTPRSILEATQKLNFLHAGGVDQWDLSSINPNRQKFLAQIGRRSTNQALQRMDQKRRFPILISFLRQSLEDIIDELVDVFDRCLTDCYARARNELKEFHQAIAKKTNEKLILFHDIGKILLDGSIPDSKVRHTIYQRIAEEEFRSSIEECDGLIRPENDHSYDFFAKRYSYIREFAPKFLETLRFYSHKKNDPLIEALETIKKLNSEGKRKVPDNTSLAFVPQSWLTYVSNGEINRRYYEISALWALRRALRSGDIWVKNSRRYADPETYLIPRDKWPTVRSESCHLLGLPEKGEERLLQRKNGLSSILSQLDNQLSQTQSDVRIEREKLVLSPLKAQDMPESTIRLQALITQMIPKVELADLLIEVDSWTNFTDQFEHAGGNQPKTKDLLSQLYASILAQACNFGLSKMAQISEQSYSQLAWCTNWYLREDTFHDAITELVNFQYKQPLSHLWGNGTMSSSDGQRFPVRGKSQNATALPRYFGYGRGLTFYSWTSDQFSQYGSKVILATVRDATYVLDAILDNETELEILEHTTDTAGYTELVFALFDLLGMQFSPRIRDLGDQRIYKYDKETNYRNLDPFLKGTIRRDLILQNWDDILRVAALISDN